MLSNNKQYVIYALILPFFVVASTFLFYYLDLWYHNSDFLALISFITCIILLTINLIFLYNAECKPLYMLSAITNYLPGSIPILSLAIILLLTTGDPTEVCHIFYNPSAQAGMMVLGMFVWIPSMVILFLLYAIIEIIIIIKLIKDLKNINENQKNHEPENNTTKELGVRQKILQYHFLVPAILLIVTVILNVSLLRCWG